MSESSLFMLAFAASQIVLTIWMEPIFPSKLVANLQLFACETLQLCRVFAMLFFKLQQRMRRFRKGATFCSWLCPLNWP